MRFSPGQRHSGGFQRMRAKKIPCIKRSAATCRRSSEGGTQWRLPLIPKDELAWDAPLNAQSETSAPALLAQRIAKAVKCWLAGEISIGDPQSETPRAPHASDIIVLTPARAAIRGDPSRAQERRCRGRGRGPAKLAEHLAVMDIAALGDALLFGKRRPCACLRAQKPASRSSTRTTFSASRWAHEHAVRGAETNDKRGRAHGAAQQKIFAGAKKHVCCVRSISVALLGATADLRKFSRGSGGSGGCIDDCSRMVAYESVETPSLRRLPCFSSRRSGSQVKRDRGQERGRSRHDRAWRRSGSADRGARGYDLCSRRRNDPWFLPMAKGADTALADLSGRSPVKTTRAPSLSPGEPCATQMRRNITAFSMVALTRPQYA